MRFILFLTFITLSLFANNPKAYTSLGDEIYNNVSKIHSLKDVQAFGEFKEKISKYVSSVKQTKKLGFAVASGERSNIKLHYLQQLREHKKLNDFFVRSALNAFKSAIDSQDNTLFIAIVNSGLIDERMYKKKIMSYYDMHKVDINPQGVIQKFLDEDLAFKNRKIWKPKTKKQIQEEKIARLRKEDSLKQEALEKKLADEVRLKKENIRQRQERELFH